MSCFGPRKNSSERVLRPVGALEAYQLALSNQNWYHSLHQGCRYTVPDATAAEAPGSERCVEETIVRALARTVLDHAAMQTAILQKTSTKAMFVQLDSLPLNEHLIWETTDDDKYDFETSLRSVSDKFLDQKWEFFSKPATPWRFVITQPKNRVGWFDLHFHWHHIYGDGTSGRVLHETFLRHLTADDGTAKSLSELSSDRTLTLPPPHLAPSQEKLINFSVSAGFLARELTKLVYSKSKYAVTWLPVDLTNVKTGYKCIKLDPAQTRAVLDACRQHQTTLTGLLEALLLLGFAAHLPADKASRFKSSTPLSLRRHITKAAQKQYGIEKPENLVGNYVSELFQHWDDDLVAKVRTQSAAAATAAEGKQGGSLSAEQEATMWEVAAKARKTITDKLSIGPRDEVTGLAHLIPNWPSYLKDLMKQPRELSWLLSNIGSFEGGHPKEAAAAVPEKAGWTIEQAAWIGSAFGYNTTSMLRATGVKGRGLFITFNWQKGNGPDEMFAEIGDDLQRWMTELGTRGQQVAA